MESPGSVARLIALVRIGVVIFIAASQALQDQNHWNYQ
jgi:hypothetical protein